MGKLHAGPVTLFDGHGNLAMYALFTISIPAVVSQEVPCRRFEPGLACYIPDADVTRELSLHQSKKFGVCQCEIPNISLRAACVLHANN